MTDTTSTPLGARPVKGYIFGHALADFDRRELAIQGIVFPLQPKVFDVLWHFLRCEGKVLSRDDLLQRFWRTGGGSDTALSRVIMKLRSALKAVPPEGTAKGPMVHTVHRVGYRLDAPGLTAWEAEGQTVGKTRTRVCAAPWRVAGPRAGAAWTELALETLLFRALTAFPELRVDGSAPDGRPASAQTGDVTLTGDLRWEADRWSAFVRLDVIGVGSVAESCSAANLQTLASAIAAYVVTTIDAAGSATWRAAVVAVAPDELARARPGTAAPPRMAALLRQAGDLGETAAGLVESCARALADTTDHTAWIDAEARLRKASAAGLVAMAAHGYHALACARLDDIGFDREAERWLNSAERLARSAGERDLEIAAQIALANVEIKRRHFSVARARYEGLLAEASIAEHPEQRARLLNCLGLVEALDGNLIGARSQFERGIRMCRQHGLDRPMLAMVANLASIQMDLACLDDAVEIFEGVLDLLGEVQPEHMAADIALSACQVFTEALVPARLEHVLALFPHWDACGRGPRHILRLMSTALHLAANHDPLAALACVREATLAALRTDDRWRATDGMRWWMCAALRSGDTASLREALATAAAHVDTADNRDPLQGAIDHVGAAIAHRQGDRAGARHLLQRAFDEHLVGSGAARARHDAAWLAAEAGETQAARVLLRGLGQWRVGHPLGWKVEARILAADGDPAALALQRRLVERMGAWAGAFDRKLLACYASRAFQPTTVPVAPLLPSLMLPAL